MYSIIDIETTGGKYGEEKIIEIALYTFDGKQTLESFSTLVNPERGIDIYVQKLTGITEKMVQRAPKFHEIAKRIIQLTQNTTLIAHNAEFDYRMLQQEFKALGYTFEMETLDTISLSQQLLPEQKYYSLKKLTKSLGILHGSAHRAYGDAQATLELFKILLEKDQHKTIIEKSINHKIYGKYAPKLLSLLVDLPHETGLYYVHNINGKIIYIGVATDISNTAHSKFTGRNFLSRKLQSKTDKLSFEITGSLLIAKIKYLQEKRALQPKLNSYENNKTPRRPKMAYSEPDMIFYEKGRKPNEKSFFIIENDSCIGYGYFQLHSQIDTPEKRKNRMIPIQETNQIRHIIQQHIKHQSKIKEKLSEK